MIHLGRRAALALAVAGCSTGAGACTRIAEAPLSTAEGYVLVPATLAGRPVSFILDTGAEGMLVTPETAATLGLPLAGMTKVYGTGGSQDARVVRLLGLRVGGAAMPDLLSPVLPLPVTVHADPPVAGLLGAALLARFDLDLDIPGKRLALWTPGDCALPPGRVMPIEVTRAGRAYLPVRVNGQDLLALMDTGSRATLLTRAAADRLGISAPISANSASGVDGERLAVGHTRVRLGLGDEAARESPISIAGIQEHGDMLLGLDVLARRRVFVSYARETISLGGSAG